MEPKIDPALAAMSKAPPTICPICDKPIVDFNYSSFEGVKGHAACVHPKDTREERKCKTCGFPRVVKVMRFWQGGKKFGERFAEHCTACEAIRSAMVHEKQARDLRAKAAEIFRRRGLNPAPSIVGTAASTT